MDGVVPRKRRALDGEAESAGERRISRSGVLEGAQGRGREKNRNKQSWDYIWRSGLAGGLAGSAAKTVVAPLDRVKILFQASNPQFAKYAGSWPGVIAAMKFIYHEDGTRGLFRGHSATILRIFPYAAIKFLAYEQIRAVFIRGPEHETPWRRLVSGSLAGVTSVFFTYPLEVIRVRLAFETKKDSRSSLSEICKRIYHEVPPPPVARSAAATPVIGTTEKAVQAIVPKSGLANFYRGFSATILGMLPYAGISFLTHDTAGDVLRHPVLAPYTTLEKPEHYAEDKPRPLRSWAELLAGGVAGLFSQTSAYPLEADAGGGDGGGWEEAVDWGDGGDDLEREGGEGVFCGVDDWVCEGGADGGGEFLYL
ncbi:mitochondrial carrier LEU5 protein [Rutstroemia sp. NJR-2017a BBW]|nr:mitochondrial carrier LEU5 protein [Rutstroemia sp. NJR-2017a BBW]